LKKNYKEMIEKYKEIIEKLLRYRKKYKYNVEKLLRLLRYRIITKII